MSSKILFWIGLDFIQYGIANYMQNKDDEFFAVFDVQDSVQNFFNTQKMVEFKKTWFYREHLKTKFENPDIEYLVDFENKYKIGIWDIAYSNILFTTKTTYYKFDDEEILSILEHECKLFEKILLESKPDFILLNLYASHATHLFCKLAQSMDIKVLMLTQTRIGYRAGLTSNLSIIDIFENNDSDSTSKQRTVEEIQNFLKKYDLKKSNQDAIDRLKKNQSYLKKIEASFKFMFLVSNRKYTEFYGNYGRKKTRILFHSLSNKIKNRARDNYLKKHATTHPNLDSKFIYFPLHVEPERTLSFGAAFVPNQLDLLPFIAKSLPVNYKLFVKEHPFMVTTEGREISYYKKINSLPNVVLVHHLANSDDLLKNCSLVVTINGTSAVEASFYGKPSITFTETGYSFLPSVTVVKNLEDLPKIISDSLQKTVDTSIPNNYIDYINANTFPLDLVKLWQQTEKTFYLGGTFGEIELDEKDMKLFLEKNEKTFRQICLEYMKKFK